MFRQTSRGLPRSTTLPSIDAAEKAGRRIGRILLPITGALRPIVRTSAEHLVADAPECSTSDPGTNDRTVGHSHPGRPGQRSAARNFGAARPGIGRAPVGRGYRDQRRRGLGAAGCVARFMQGRRGMRSRPRSWPRPPRLRPWCSVAIAGSRPKAYGRVRPSRPPRGSGGRRGRSGGAARPRPDRSRRRHGPGGSAGQLDDLAATADKTPSRGAHTTSWRGIRNTSSNVLTDRWRSIGP